LSEAEDGASNLRAADIFVDGDATGSLRACRSIADSRNFEKSSLALAQSEEERVAFGPIGSITSGICGNSPDVLNLRRITRDNSVGRDFERHVGENDMPRAAQLFAPMSATSASARKSDRIPLDPIVLFSGIGLLAFLIAVATGVQGVWY
jgi:hypothetical protein